MKITWEFADGTSSSLEVEDKYGKVIIESRLNEESGNHYERIHCCSLESAQYEGMEYADLKTPETECDNIILAEQMELVWKSLTPIQRRRLDMYTNGLTETEIASIEGVSQSKVSNSIAGARKKFKKIDR